jgi:hypothetical protein
VSIRPMRVFARLLVVATIGSSGSALGAQASRAPTTDSLYMPRAIRQAYVKRTRSMDGRPGAKYWRNRGRYTMTITALPPDRTVRGTEEITYVNASPDTLRGLIIKLFQNIHKPGAPRNGGSPEAYLTPGVQIDAHKR